MSYSITIGSIAKSKNSTKQGMSGGTTINGVLLKDGSSVVNPTFRIKHNSTPSTMSKYNYVDAFGCYYYIDDIISLNNDIWEISCTRDPMATFKSSIGSSHEYITRSSDSRIYNKDLYDNIIAPSSNIVKTMNVSESTAFTLGNPTIVFGFNGSGGIRTSADTTNFYYTSTASASSILGRVFCTSNDIFTTIIQQFQQISHNITMVKCFPFAKADTSGSSSTVYVGEWDISCNDLETMSVGNFSTGTTGRRWGDIVTLDIPSSSSLHYGDYRDYDANFTECTLHVPLVGSVSINPQYLRYEKIELTYSVDMISGVGECTIRAYSSYSGVNQYMVIGVYNFIAGYDVPISATTENVSQIATNILSMNPTGVILDAISPPISYTTISGGSGMANIYLDKVVLEIKTMGSEYMTYENNRGFKVMKNKTINTVADNSYIECLNPHCKPNGATPQEIDTINGYMQGGFYYE